MNSLRIVDDEAIGAYLAVIDDGEIARLAAAMTPRSEVFDAHVLISQAAALQAEAEVELVRRREQLAKKMDQNTLRELARQLGYNEVGFLLMIDDDCLTHPITGPVLRRLASLMRKLPIYQQEFHDDFLEKNPMAVLETASERTAIPRPHPDACFEDCLRYAANIPTDEISWDLLDQAFFDFFRIYCLYPPMPASLIPNDMEGGLTKRKLVRMLGDLRLHFQNRDDFLEAFVPGQSFPPDVEDYARRAYRECWEEGLGHLWLERLAWLAAEFTPFWQRYGNKYHSIYQPIRDAAAESKKKRSTEAARKGEKGRSRREDKRWRDITHDFNRFIESRPKAERSLRLNEFLNLFSHNDGIRGGLQNRVNSREFLQALCTGVEANMNARDVLDILQRSLLVKYEALDQMRLEEKLTKLTPTQRSEYRKKGTIPSKWLQFKSLSEDTVRDCLAFLTNASADSAKISAK